MEITRTFTRGFRDIMRAKWRGFVRRSAARYAVAVALLTMAIHGANPALDLIDKMLRGLLYFVVLCMGVLLVQMLAALVQSRRSMPRTITFAESDIRVDCAGASSHHGWDWILAAEESPTTLSLLVRKAPRLELYLPRSKFGPDDYRVLRGWLVAHGKLSTDQLIS